MKPHDLIGAEVVLNIRPARGQRGMILNPIERAYGEDAEPHHSHLQKTLYAVRIPDWDHTIWAYGSEFDECG
jgi:hypothetical protein